MIVYSITHLKYIIINKHNSNCIKFNYKVTQPFIKPIMTVPIISKLIKQPSNHSKQLNLNSILYSSLT